MIEKYLQAIQKKYKTGDSTEQSYYGILERLLEDFLKSKGVKPNITIQPKKTKAGIPDFVVRNQKSQLIGYIEAKDLNIALEKIEDTEQIRRYKEKLPNFILTNYFDFWLWRRDSVDEKEGCWIKKIRIAQPSILKLNAIPPAQNKEEFIDLLRSFFSFYIPERKTAKSLAKELASRANLIPPQIIYLLNDEKEEEIDRIYNAFKKYLISDLSKEDFADIYTQTITYGLFTARLRYKGKDFNRSLASRFIPKNIKILHDTFSLISSNALPEAITPYIDDMATILANADIEKIKEELHKEKGGDDPLMHFYETFLAEYDPKKRKARGVYYTPLPVVSYITRSISLLLKERFNKKFGFASNGVTLLDPASGTLTFLANSIILAKEEIEKSSIAGSWLQIIKNHILKNFYAFELLMAPYIIGHLKISLLLEDLGYKLDNNERFQLYLTNTLDLSEISQSQMPFIAGLSEEAQKAKKIKEKIPVLVVMGNPPYSVSSSNIIKEDSDFYELYESYKENVRKEEKNIQPLSDDYIKFIAFAHWKIKQAGQGIIGMITNNSYLDGLIHRDMRKKLAEDFDEIYILNLHGNLKRKEKTPEGGKDENVFDIQQGVGIIVLVKKEGLNKKINYFDLYGLREEKYKFLESHDIKNTKWQELKLREPNYFFIPKDIKGEKIYDNFISLKDIFNKYNAGIATGKDDVLVDFNKDSLVRKLSITDKDLFKTLMEGYKVNKDSIEKWYVELKNQEIDKQIKPYNYRIFDRRFVIYNNKILQRARDVLMKYLLRENIALVTTKILSSKKYEHAFISDCISDRCFISNRGREANYFFPLFIYSNNNNSLFEKGVNFSPKLWNYVPSGIEAEKVFYYIYAILYSNIYRQKYNEFLKIDFPKIPFTKDEKLFNQIAELGKELVDLHLLKPEKLEKPTAKFPVIGDNVVKQRKYNPKEKRIYINEKQYFENVEPEIWNYYIGGYQVLDKWLKDRIGKILSAENVEHYLKIITVLKHTIKLQKEIDKIYPEIEENLMK